VLVLVIVPVLTTPKELVFVVKNTLALRIKLNAISFPFLLML
jgi:hypothetical protein